MPQHFSRRQFHVQSAVAGAALLAPPLRAESKERKKLPVVGITTVYRRNTHADVIFGKILEGYDQKGGAGPALKLSALYVEQKPDGDLSKELAAKYGVPICKTIDEAIGVAAKDDQLAGVVSVGEHGTYPSTPDTKQKMYPRRRFFDEIVAALRRVKRKVPVFSDKHLSYKWTDAKHMVDLAKEMKLPFMAGSSVPVAWRSPGVALPMGADLEQAIGIGYGGAESYGFHALEGLQCMIERRKGAETGVKSVQTVTGDGIWRAEKEGWWSREVLQAALQLQPYARKRTAKGKWEDRLSKRSPFYLIEYKDGLRATLAMMNGVCADFGFAAKIRNQSKPIAVRYILEEKQPFGHFSWLLQGIEEMVHSGRAAYPVERTLLTTGILDRAMHSLADGGRIFATPELLSVKYRPTTWGWATSEPFKPPQTP